MKENHTFYNLQKLKDFFSQIITILWKGHTNKIQFQTKDDDSAKQMVPYGNDSNREGFTIWKTPNNIRAKVLINMMKSNLRQYLKG